MNSTMLMLLVCACDVGADVTWKERLHLGQQLEHAGRLEEAEKIFLQELRTTEQSEPGTYREAAILTNLANVYDALGRYLQASGPSPYSKRRSGRRPKAH